MIKRETELGPIFGPPIPIPRGPKGRIRWGELAREPSIFKVVVLQEASNVIAEGEKFNSYTLKKRGRNDLTRAVNRYYPDGFLGVSKELKADFSVKRPWGYWLNPENVRAAAAEALEGGVEITSHKLSKAGLGQLTQAIQRNYPGGWTQIREDLGIDKSYNRPPGYWTEENLLKEAAAFLEKYGDFSYKLLQTSQEYGFANAISRYPGGIYQLKQQLNIPANARPKGHYNDPANLEADARAILEETGTLTNKQLARWKSVFKNKKYPGGARALKEKLGVASERVAPDYWTIERIQDEAKKFLQEHGKLSQRDLQRKGPRGLVKAIANKYPGALTGLQGFLEVKDSNTQPSREEANDALASLFEL